MSQRWQVILSNLAVVALFSVACASGTNEDFDILIENGKVVDGTGGPSRQVDVRIDGHQRNSAATSVEFLASNSDFHGGCRR